MNLSVGQRVQSTSPNPDQYDTGIVIEVYSCGDVRVKWDIAGETYDEPSDEVEPAGPRTFVARFMNHWGVGATVVESVANARKVGGRGKDYYVVMLPEGASDIRVDCMGAVHWGGPTENATVAKASGCCAKRLRVGGAE